MVASYTPACVRIQHTSPRPEPSSLIGVFQPLGFGGASSCVVKLKKHLARFFRFKTREPCFCVLRHRQEPKHCWTTSRHVSSLLFSWFHKEETLSHQSNHCLFALCCKKNQHYYRILQSTMLEKNTSNNIASVYHKSISLSTFIHSIIPISVRWT